MTHGRDLAKQLAEIALKKAAPCDIHRHAHSFACGVFVERERRRVEYALDVLAKAGQPVQLAKDGTWMVSPEKRPKGWQSMGLAEPATVPES